jgi:hypothetical protein
MSKSGQQWRDERFRLTRVSGQNIIPLRSRVRATRIGLRPDCPKTRTPLRLEILIRFPWPPSEWLLRRGFKPVVGKESVDLRSAEAAFKAEI